MKYFEYLVCFTTGFAILVLELAAFRLLAPYFGSSNYVTGSIINTILLALALGYYIGGYAADTYKSEKLPYFVILGAGLYLLLILFLHQALLSALVTLPVILGSSLVILIMFFLPMILLAFIPPYFIKMLAKKGSVGRAAGEISALSTLGSILGGFLTTFLFIPHFGSRLTFIIALLLVFLIAIVGLLRFHLLASMLLLLLVPPLLLQPAAGEELYRTESAYNVIRVTESRGNFFLRLNDNFGYHSQTLDKSKRTHSYYDHYLFPQMVMVADSTLILGNGAGTSMMQIHHFFPTQIHGVEIDPALTAVGKKFFGLDLDERLSITHEDARTHLLKNAEQYDIIYVDVFAGSLYIPFHVATEEFFSLVAARLEDDGILSVNLALSPTESELGRSIVNTIATSFPSIYVTDRVLFAFKEEISLEELRQISGEGILGDVAAEVIEQLRPVTVGEVIFTDDYAPIDQMTYPVLKEKRAAWLEWQGGKI